LVFGSKEALDAWQAWHGFSCALADHRRRTARVKQANFGGPRLSGG